MPADRSSRARWERYFDDGVASGDAREIAAAVDAATRASERGASEADAKAAGRSAARAYRERSGPAPRTSTGPRARAQPSHTTYAEPSSGPAVHWSPELASKLFTPPARWGWQVPARVEATPPVTTVELPERPRWVEPFRPDAGPLRVAARRAARSMTWRVAGAVVLVAAFLAFQDVIRRTLIRLNGRLESVYGVLVAVAGGIVLLGLLGAARDVRRAQREVDAFDRPYRETRAAEKLRYDRAVADWEAATRSHREETANARRPTHADPSAPIWFPVRPRQDPSRVDVLGGDRMRHGWASLLMTVGTALLAGGRRVTVIDLTGQQVGGGLVDVARARRMATWTASADTSEGLAILASVPRPELAAALADAFTQAEGNEDRREQRAFVLDVLRRIVLTLPEPLTCARLASAVRVLNRSSGTGQLEPDEVSELLTRHLADLHSGEWNARQLSLLAAQLDLLAEATNDAGGQPLFGPAPLTVVETEGGRTDRKQVTDHAVVQSVLRALDARRLTGALVVAGVDHLGAATVQTLSDYALRAGVLLILLIDQFHGPLEGLAGTGGVACVMKMYNHRDAQAAAEFVGRGHSFVLSGISRQVGKSFGETGGDSITTNTGDSSTTKVRAGGSRKRTSSLSDSRGHAWSGTRSWTSSDSLSTTESTSRVYEFIVEPSTILDMPTTAFLLIDNTGAERRVMLVDGNPGISLLDRVSPVLM